jgi:hypothetical protein
MPSLGIGQDDSLLVKQNKVCAAQALRIVPFAVVLAHFQSGSLFDPSS